MNPFQSRRQFFTTGRNVLGSAALASLLGDSVATAGQSAADRTALRAEGETRHLPAHGWRPRADGSVRLQAGDAGLV